uniref:Aspartate aminotransferase cytoplasmic-like n=1 Tax=Rhizophora mucronata TaxID=61149 RepID=A0A2P2LKP7_RHIMU
MEPSSAGEARRSKHSDGDSAFENVPRAPDIPVYAVIAAYGEDRSPVKLNLSFGVYRTEDGKPHLLNVVKQAEQLLLDDLWGISLF